MELRLSLWLVGRKISGHWGTRSREGQRTLSAQKSTPVNLWEGVGCTFVDFKRQGSAGRDRKGWTDPNCKDPGAGLAPSSVQHSSVVSYRVPC